MGFFHIGNEAVREGIHEFVVRVFTSKSTYFYILICCFITVRYCTWFFYVSALREGNAEAADVIHKSLMVDYVSQCSQWMSGVRQLINLKRN